MIATAHAEARRTRSVEKIDSLKRFGHHIAPNLLIHIEGAVPARKMLASNMNSIARRIS